MQLEALGDTSALRWVKPLKVMCILAFFALPSATRGYTDFSPRVERKMLEGIPKKDRHSCGNAGLCALCLWLGFRGIARSLALTIAAMLASLALALGAAL